MAKKTKAVSKDKKKVTVPIRLAADHPDANGKRHHLAYLTNEERALLAKMAGVDIPTEGVPHDQLNIPTGPGGVPVLFIGGMGDGGDPSGDIGDAPGGRGGDYGGGGIGAGAGGGFAGGIAGGAVGSFGPTNLSPNSEPGIGGFGFISNRQIAEQTVAPSRSPSRSKASTQAAANKAKADASKAGLPGSAVAAGVANRGASSAPSGVMGANAAGGQISGGLGQGGFSGRGIGAPAGGMGVGAAGGQISGNTGIGPTGGHSGVGVAGMSSPGYGGALGGGRGAMGGLMGGLSSGGQDAEGEAGVGRGADRGPGYGGRQGPGGIASAADNLGSMAANIGVRGTRSGPQSSVPGNISPGQMGPAPGTPSANRSAVKGVTATNVGPNTFGQVSNLGLLGLVDDIFGQEQATSALTSDRAQAENIAARARAAQTRSQLATEHPNAQLAAQRAARAAVLGQLTNENRPDRVQGPATFGAIGKVIGANPSDRISPGFMSRTPSNVVDDQAQRTSTVSPTRKGITDRVSSMATEHPNAQAQAQAAARARAQIAAASQLASDQVDDARAAARAAASAQPSIAAQAIKADLTPSEIQGFLAAFAPNLTAENLANSRAVSNAVRNTMPDPMSQMLSTPEQIGAFLGITPEEAAALMSDDMTLPAQQDIEDQSQIGVLRSDEVANNPDAIDATDIARSAIQSGTMPGIADLAGLLGFGSPMSGAESGGGNAPASDDYIPGRGETVWERPIAALLDTIFNGGFGDSGGNFPDRPEWGGPPGLLYRPYTNPWATRNPWI